MHARIEQLLSLRDGGPVDAAVQAHVAVCAACTQSLAGLGRLRERLAALPTPEVMRRDWEAVKRDVARRVSNERRRHLVTRGALVASVAIIALATAWRLHDPAVRSASLAVPSAQDAQLALAADRLEQLRSQSEALEDLLSELPRQPAIERAGTALPMDTIEAQVQWLDHQILLHEDELRPDTAEQLWRERVEAMNSLVRLRYADAQRVAM
jgi:hypothetical protein